MKQFYDICASLTGCGVERWQTARVQTQMLPTEFEHTVVVGATSTAQTWRDQSLQCGPICWCRVTKLNCSHIHVGDYIYHCTLCLRMYNGACIYRRKFNDCTKIAVKGCQAFTFISLCCCLLNGKQLAAQTPWPTGIISPRHEITAGL